MARSGAAAGKPAMTSGDFVAGAATLGLVLAIWWPLRLAIAQHMERTFEDAHPRNADGVIIGAEPIHVRGVRPGAVLVLHGYNDSPQSVAPLANALHDAGWTVAVPLLPGHGRTLQAFARSDAAAWMAAAREHYRALREQHEQVAVCGMSMGGALAFILAAENPDLRAVVGIASYLHLSRPMEALLVLAPIAAIGARYLSGGGGKSIHDPVAAAAVISYKRSTPKLLVELTRVTRVAYNALPGVRQPVLMVMSREDNRIPVRSATEAFERLGSQEKTLEWVSGTGHVLTLDYGHEEMERRVIAWLSEHLE
jgi:carboxylesterase